MTKPKIHPTKGQVKGKSPSKRGRKSTVTPEKTAIFLWAVENGFTMKEAQQESGISQDAYDRHRAKSAEFRGQIEVAKMKLNMVARGKLASAINNGDMPTVRWYLERKIPEEFRPQSGDEGMPLIPPNMVWIIPGGKHPRITPQDEQ